MEQVNPTRMELIRLRAKIALATQGRDLLRQKMDALVQEFFREMDTVRHSRGELMVSSDQAWQSLAIASAVDGPDRVTSASLAARRTITIDIRGRNVMGVPVPVIEKTKVRRMTTGRGYSPTAISVRVNEVADQFEEEVDLIIRLAEQETVLRRLGHEIQMCRRRVNALEQMLIPEMQRQERRIRFVIEERERENIFRLKRVKALLARQQTVEEGEAGVPSAI